MLQRRYFVITAMQMLSINIMGKDVMTHEKECCEMGGKKAAPSLEESYFF